MKTLIDTSFDFRTDSNGADPDSASATLKSYHKTLWSKALPNGKIFTLDDTKPNTYLYHKSELGEYYLSSDGITHTYSHWKRMKHIIEQIPQDEKDNFEYLGYTLGGFLIFPGNKVNGFNTINQERGVNKYINDRIDLTLECIRKYYHDETSPLYETLQRYKDFFDLFIDFKGYCEYFLLQDLVSPDFKNIQLFLPFTDFIYNPLPQDITEYYEYRQNVIDFINKRNIRILQYQMSL